MNRFKKTLLSIGLMVLTVCLSLVGFIACKDSNEVVITFDTDGGTAISKVEKTKGSEYELPIPEKEGYGFDGWYTNENFEGDPVTTIVATKNATYYAKWTKTYEITLDLDGGSLAEGTTLMLKEGANVYDFMQNYVPTKSSLVFGAWFNGTSELSKNTRMTSAGITLSAKYKVAYTVEIYEQNMALDGYEKAEDTITGYAYVNEKFVSEQTRTGFKEVLNDNTVDTLVLSENAEKNIYKHYFDRQKYVVSFNANYPDGSEAEIVSTTVLYGEEVELLSDYTFEGYCLIGWATSASGEAVYEANYIDSVLYNAEDKSEAATFVPSRNTALYGVWLKGYGDMFGNGDYIYILDENSEEAYLSRGGVFFKGEYNAEKKEFLFVDSNDDVLLEGKLNSDSTYVYYDATRSSTAYTLLNVGVGLDTNTKIYFDEYDGLDYSVADDIGHTTSSLGTYYVDENGYYNATFTEGPRAGETIIFVVGYVTLNDGTNYPAFQLRNEEEYAIGTLVQFAMQGGKPTAQELNGIELTGFGFATMNKGSYLYPYYYTMGEETITLIDYYYGTEATYYLVEIDGVLGYVSGNDLKGTYTLNGGYSLILDGIYNATYKYKDGTSITGYYEIANSQLNGYIVTMYTSKETYKFLIANHTVTLPDANGDSIELKYTTVEKKLENYCEYIYYQDGKLYYSGLLVANENVEGDATLYGYDKTAGEYVKVSSGTLVLNEETGRYLYTATEYYELETEILTEPKDLSQLKSFVCALDSTTTAYNIYYTYADETEEGWTEYDVVYTSDKGGKLLLVNGFAVYSESGFVIAGVSSLSENLMTIQASSGKIYVEIDEENKKFVSLDHAPYSAYFIKADGYTNKNEYLSFDGKGGVIYTIVTVNEETDEKTETTYEGTYAETDKTTAFGAPVYQFTSTEKSFEFLMLYTSSAVYITVYNEEYNGDYVAESGAMLKLDGFSYMASFTETNGNYYEGVYCVSAENEITLSTDYGTLYFDLTENRGFTVRGTEYGTYIMIDNQAMNGYYLEFNGYNGLTVYTYEEVPVEGGEEGETKSERVDIDTEATYELNDQDCTITYTKDNQLITLVGGLASASDGTYVYNFFVISYKEVVQTFVNEKDWSVLVLDDIGNATRYSSTGVAEYGSYVIITENLLYYVNSEGTDASIYNYDVASGKISPSKFQAMGYYTKELESLLFSQYGFAIFNATDYYYYSKDASGNVTIYRQDPNDENANKYGFVAEAFGLQSDVKEWGGKTYYSNNGYAITFQRNAEGAEKYPLSINDGKYPLENIVFTPSGEAEFSVTAVVTINGETYSGYAVRTIDEEGNVETYVTVGYYRFDIELDYRGQTEDENNNTYTITRMRNILEAPSATYQELQYMLISWLGSNAANLIENTYGTISIVIEYDEAGEQTAQYFTGNFGKNSGLTDTKGNIISVENAPFEMYKSNIYKVAVAAEDGYTYNLYIGLAKHSYFGTYGYEVYAFTREQTLTYGDYTVEVERIVKTESTSLKAGMVFSLSVKMGEAEIAADSIYIPKTNTAYYIVRSKDEDGLFIGSTYYVVEFTEYVSGSIDEENTVAYPAYESVTVTTHNVTTYYSENAVSYIDVNENHEVMLLSYYGTVAVVASSEYDEATNTYTVTTTSLVTYKITFTEEGVAIFEKQEATDEKTEEA